MKRTHTISYFIIRLILLIGAFISIFPFIWMIIGTTQNPNDVVRGVLKPGNEFLSNWKKVNASYSVFTFFMNSFVIAFTTVAGGLVINGLAAFGFEKYRSRKREVFFNILLVSMILPQMAIVIPLFRQMAFFNLLNTRIAIILPSLVSVFIIFFLRQNFKMFPTEIMEAARVDGAGELSIFLRIVVPSMKATFASASIYLFLGQWNSYLWPLMTILSDAKKTLPIAMSSMMRAYTIEYGGLMILVCISTLPILVLFLTMQRQFVAGLLGSIK
ncbi:MAG TPA: carbohydrate ABC transporter permease [Termitinemataceae bacterium]|nr:carbohydrate ABC transporter permease [Treponemataceae bacterium]HOJ99258.1 carbohydrate ABC transporter permease [Termitinemataceae bacterium]HOM23393.1 carbohydrate ABC transporter permease [Termitinemataceae bacterium]HPQ01256.1 carbohydrate ABC transporter permease [Termitinemataceae bacterium]